MIPGLLPIFLHGCKIKSGSGLHGDKAIDIPAKPLPYQLSNTNLGFQCIIHSSGGLGTELRMHMQVHTTEEGSMKTNVTCMYPSMLEDILCLSSYDG